MANNIEIIEGNIKEEVIYTDVADVPELYQVVSSGDCFIQEDGTLLVNGADVQCQEIEIDTEDASFQKFEVVETDANVYEFDPNSSAPFFTFSGSESSPMKKEFLQTNINSEFNNKNYVVKHHIKSKPQGNQSLSLKKLELNNIKQFGTRHIKQDQDEWYQNSDRKNYLDPMGIGNIKQDKDEWYPSSDHKNYGDDDFMNDYNLKRRDYGKFNTGGKTKPKKRKYAERHESLIDEDFKDFNKKGKRLLWKDSNMMEAMQRVNDGLMTIRGAAKYYEVPYSTLKDRVKGRVTHGTKPGVKTALSPNSELDLVRIVLYMRECGFSVACQDIREKAHEIQKREPKPAPNPQKKDLKPQAKKKDQKPQNLSQNMPGHNWLTGFLKRHPEVNNPKPSSRVMSPSSSKSSHMVKKFFEISNRVYQRIIGEDRESRIFCVASMHLPSLPKISLILTASVDGILHPPYVYGNFSRSLLNAMHVAFPGAIFVSSHDVTPESVLGYWFRDFFLLRMKPTNCRKPHALFVNQCSKYVPMALVEMCMQRDVHMICIPLPLSQALQPLNGLPNSLEQSYQKCLKWVVHNGSDLGHSSGDISEPNDIQIAQALKRVFDKSESYRGEIQKNFIDNGIYPLNSRAVNLEKISTTYNEEDWGFNVGFDENQMDHSNVGRDYAQDHGNGIRDEGGLHLLSELSTAVRTPADSYGSHFSEHSSSYKYKNVYNQDSSERRAPRAKRYAAGESEKFMKQFLEGSENEYHDIKGGYFKKRRIMEDESDFSASSVDSEHWSCARTRPIKSNHSSAYQDRSDSLSNETLSEYDGRELYGIKGDDIKSSEGYFMRENNHQNSFNMNDDEVINQAVASILPKEDLFSPDHSGIRVPSLVTKYPKLQYILRNPTQKPMQNIISNYSDLHSHQISDPIGEEVLPATRVEEIDMAIQEEVITTDLDQYFINNPQLGSEEVTVEEVVMDDIVTAIYDDEPASIAVPENLIFPQHPTNNDEASLLRIEPQVADNLPTPIVLLPPEEFEHGPSSSEAYAVDYEVEPAPTQLEQISDEDIVLGDKVYKSSQLVKMTTHLVLDSHHVEIIRQVTLKEAMDTFQKNDPRVIKCNLQFIKS